jgi:hypothetical protein
VPNSGVESRGRDCKQFYGSWLRSIEAPAFCIHPQPGVCNVSRSGYGAAAQGCVTSKLEDNAQRIIRRRHSGAEHRAVWPQGELYLPRFAHRNRPRSRAMIKAASARAIPATA